MPALPGRGGPHPGHSPGKPKQPSSTYQLSAPVITGRRKPEDKTPIYGMARSCLDPATPVKKQAPCSFNTCGFLETQAGGLLRCLLSRKGGRAVEEVASSSGGRGLGPGLREPGPGGGLAS